jgi:anti-sigma factor RsiW
MERDLLSAYLDGECTPDERVYVEAQLAADQSWRDELAMVREARASLRLLPMLELPNGFLDTLAASIDTVDLDAERDVERNIDVRDVAVIDLTDVDDSVRVSSMPSPSQRSFVRKPARRRRWMFSAATTGLVTAAAAALILVMPAPAIDRPVKPALAAYVDTHVAQSSMADEPVMHVATAAMSDTRLASTGFNR